MSSSKVIVVGALASAACIVGTPRISHAAIEIPPPSGAGTEQVGSAGNREGIAPGWEASGEMGTGFSDTYGLGIAGRVGYTLPMGIYVGGQVQAFWGQTYGSQNAHATFLGGEVGYKLYPLPSALNGALSALEVRPYVFAGPAFISESTSEAPYVRSKTGFALQPGTLAVVHVGPAFVGADFRMLVTPSPFGAALLGSAGAGF